MDFENIVSNVKIYDLEESLLASGYPMRTDLSPRAINDKDIQRGHTLSAACDTGNGAHGQFMTGIRVNFDLTFTNKAWVEAERYHFLDFVSSQSTMHCISKMDIRNMCNKYVTETTIKEVERLKDMYLTTESKEDYLRLLYNIPSGFELTARMTTNYRQLKTIYQQRRTHRLPDWQMFCDWIENELPHSEFITQKFSEK